MDIEVKVAKDEIEKKKKEIIAKIKSDKTFIVPGFRKGRVPDYVIEKKLGEGLKEQIVSEFASQSLEKVAEERKITPVTRPTISYWNFIEENELRFGIEMEIIPTLKDLRYDDIEIDEVFTPSIDEYKRKVREKLLSEFSDYIETEGPVKIKDIVNVEVDNSSHSFFVEIGSGLMPVIWDKILQGKKKGEEFEAEVEYPADFDYDDLKSKKLKQKIKIISIKTLKVPEITKDIIEELGYKSLEEFNEAVEKEAQELLDKEKRRETEEKIIDSLIKINKFSLPPSLLNIGNGKFEDEEAKKKFTESMERILKKDIILTRIAEKEGFIRNNKEGKQEIDNEKLFDFLKERVRIKGGVIVHPNSN